MAASTSADPGRIFISYRREDSAFPAGWLYDRLCAHFGSDYVFKDVDSIDPVCQPQSNDVVAVRYWLFSDQATLDAHFKNSFSDSPRSCGPADSPQSWHRAASPQQTEGRVMCFSSGGINDTYLVWTVDSQLLLGEVIAQYVGGYFVGNDRVTDPAYKWWANRYQI
jgi:hypothetical protein